ncbi:hypothetical protein OH76DRAFT_280428 [Lentinus brumalis]|uniref:Uncharacterized protein n=1 Tax=Lentinus brumalis TaxID=2498619 RepID=A0A371CKY7_9APHY|nr:hypothetical protein OH76DRAFT_280428 [Polyporus brumalis]
MCSHPPTGGLSISSTRVRISSPSALSARSRRIEGARQMPSRAAISTGALGLGSVLVTTHDSRPTPSSCPLHVEIGRFTNHVLVPLGLPCKLASRTPCLLGFTEASALQLPQAPATVGHDYQASQRT